MKSIQIESTVHVDIEKIMDAMEPDDVAKLLNAVALRFDSQFRERRDCAEAFADNTSEIGARFLAEIIASTIGR